VEHRIDVADRVVDASRPDEQGDRKRVVVVDACDDQRRQFRLASRWPFPPEALFNVLAQI
jgi:hypothetical protein